MLFWLLFFQFVSSCFGVACPVILGIEDYGAQHGNKTQGEDVGPALRQAFEASINMTRGSETCTTAIVRIPTGDFRLMSPVHVFGLENVVIDWNGIIHLSHIEEDEFEAESMLYFHGGSNLTLEASQGGSIWGYGSDYRPNGTVADKYRRNLLRFNEVGDLRVRGLMLIDSPRFHLTTFACSNVEISNISVWMPPPYVGTTDGIDVSGVNISVDNIDVTNGDDCVVVKNPSRQVHISNVNCSNGGGVTVGSAGHDAEWDVQDISFENITLLDTHSGAEIKSFEDCDGIIKDISWSNVVSNNASYPAAIKLSWKTTTDKSYNLLKSDRRGIILDNVTFTNFTGTSSDVIKTDNPSAKNKYREAIFIDCPESTTCTHIQFQNFSIPDRVPRLVKGACGAGIPELEHCEEPHYPAPPEPEAASAHPSTTATSTTSDCSGNTSCPRS